MLKIAVLAPMPRARVKSTVILTRGDRHIVLRANRRSCHRPIEPPRPETGKSRKEAEECSGTPVRGYDEQFRSQRVASGQRQEAQLFSDEEEAAPRKKLVRFSRSLFESGQGGCGDL